MNRIEYIPGDLVNTLFGIAKITNVYKEGSYDFEGKSFSGSDTCEPIPLTPEILEKNGWKKTDATWIYKREDSVTIFRLLDDKSYAAYIGNIRLLEFQFVHQLQHILFGLGLKTEMEV